MTVISGSQEEVRFSLMLIGSARRLELRQANELDTLMSASELRAR